MVEILKHPMPKPEEADHACVQAARLSRLEENQKILLDRMNKLLTVVSSLSMRFEGAAAVLARDRVLTRERHALFTTKFVEHDRALDEIRTLKTIRERLEKANAYNSGSPPIRIYLEDLGLMPLLRDERGKAVLSQDEAAKVLASGVPCTIHMRRFFREVYGLELVGGEIVEETTAEIKNAPETGA
jgi:hypothetical protein